jgi:NAD(P)H dehydrogenase (quinone)
VLAQSQVNIADGLLAETPGDLFSLEGRPTTPMRDTRRRRARSVITAPPH